MVIYCLFHGLHNVSWLLNGLLMGIHQGISVGFDTWRNDVSSGIYVYVSWRVDTSQMIA